MTEGIYKIFEGHEAYIGSSLNVEGRKKTHLRHLRRGAHHCHKLQKLFDKGIRFKFKIIEKTNFTKKKSIKLVALEQYYMDTFKGKLLNSSVCAHAPMLDPRVRAKRTGKTHSPETRKKISDSWKGDTKKRRQRISSALMGRKLSDETRKRMSKSHKGLIKSRETCEALSRALTGRKLSKQHCINIGRGHQGMKHSKKSREKMSITRTGRKASKAHCKAISQGLKRKYATGWSPKKNLPLN